jgi:hypothetical protein
MKNDITRHLENEVSEKEYPGAEAVYRIAEVEIRCHMQLGETDIDPVDRCRQIAEHENRQDMQRYFPEQPVFCFGRRSEYRGGCGETLRGIHIGAPQSCSCFGNVSFMR